jgi:hypothetical protein
MALSDRAVSFDLWSAFGAIQTWAWAGTIGLSRFLQRDLSVPCGTVRLTRSIPLALLRKRKAPASTWPLKLDKEIRSMPPWGVVAS